MAKRSSNRRRDHWRPTSVCRALRQDGRFELRTATPGDGSPRTAQWHRVAIADGTSIEADVAVDCAGPAALALLRASASVGSDADARTQRVAAPPSLPQVAYFNSVSAADTGGALPPVFIEWGDNMLYGLPVHVHGAPTTYKISHHTPGRPVLDTYDPTGGLPDGTDDVTFDDDPDLLAMLTGAVRRLLPSLDPTPVGTERCVYDNSADTDFILDRVGHVVVGCGTSGHGFKFGPLFGVLLADLAEGTTSEFDLRRFSIDRIPAAP